MTNKEFYKNEMIDSIKNGVLCTNFTSEKILPFYEVCCNDITCRECDTLKVFWLDEEYKKPEIDWNKVEVDTPILVRFTEDKSWERRHFAKYENGNVYAWSDGGTSFTTAKITGWDYARLYKEGDSNNE